MPAGDPPHVRRRIVQVAAPGPVGGLESVVLALAAGQVRRGHDVTVAVISEPGQSREFENALKNAGVPTETFVVSAKAYLRERRLVGNFFRRVQPHIVHTHGYRPDILHAATRLRRRFATVTTLHGSSRVGGITTLHERLQLLLLRRFDAVVAVSRELAQSLSGRYVSANRLHVIPNAWNGAIRAVSRVDARRALGLPAEGKVIGWVGRLIPVKGADVFIRAARILDVGNVSFSIVGDGTERARLESLAREEGIADRLRFHGTVPEAARYLSAFDAFVLSSRSEGTPVTLLEAMAAKVPLIVTKVGGVPDVVGDGEAVLVAKEDPPALAEGIRSVLTDPQAAAVRANAAWARLQSQFEAERWIAAHDTLYEEILSRRR